MSKSYECQRAKVLQSNGLDVAEGSKELIHLISGVLVTGGVEEKTTLDGHGESVFREPPYFRGEVVIWRSFRREQKVRPRHIWTMCGESLVMDVGDAGASGVMKHEGVHIM